MIKQEIIKGEGPTFENDTVIGVSSSNLKKGVLTGSYVIIPKSAVSNPFELTKKEWQDTYELMQVIKQYIDKTYNPDGYNLGWNVGRAAGQGIAHAHFHIIPRYKDEPFAGKGIRSWLKREENARKV